MNRFFYSLLLLLFSPIIALYFLSRGIKDPDYLKHWQQRLGFLPTDTKRNAIHIHCASVGESRAALPLIKRLLQALPNDSILISCSTPTARKELCNFALNNKQYSIQVVYLAVDWFGATRRFVQRLQPKISILMETELWPNLIFTLNKYEIPIMLANARLSQSAVDKYLRFATFSCSFLTKIDRVIAQYQADSEHFLKLGVAFDRLSTCGNIKFDLEISAQLIKQQQALRHSWSANRPCWIAASIHPAEFSIIFDAHKDLLKRFPDLLLIAVARHPERFFELKKLAMQRSINFVQRSDNQSPSSDHSLIIGDTMGELMQFYGAADVAFVGGSLIPHGGQNPIEPAACRLPVIIGPSVFNFAWVCEEMQQQGVLEILEQKPSFVQAHHLAQSVSQILSNQEKQLAAVQASKQLFADNQGGLDNIIQTVEELLDNQ